MPPLLRITHFMADTFFLNHSESSSENNATGNLIRNVRHAKVRPSVNIFITGLEVVLSH